MKMKDMKMQYMKIDDIKQLLTCSGVTGLRWS